MVTFLELWRPCKRPLFSTTTERPTTRLLAPVGTNFMLSIEMKCGGAGIQRPASACFLKFANHEARVPQKRSDPSPITTDPRLQPKFRFLPAVNNRPIAKYRIRNWRVVAKGSEAIVSDCRDEVFAILEMRSVQFLR